MRDRVTACNKVVAWVAWCPIWAMQVCEAKVPVMLVAAIVVIPVVKARDAWATQVCEARVPVMLVAATVVIPVNRAWDKAAA